MILQLSRRICASSSRFCALPELSRTMTSTSSDSPGAGLHNPGTGQQIVPMRRKKIEAARISCRLERAGRAAAKDACDSRPAHSWSLIRQSESPQRLSRRRPRWQKGCQSICCPRREPLLPHKARSFAALPGPDRAPPLLADVATAPCRFAPADGGRPARALWRRQSRPSGARFPQGRGTGFRHGHRPRRRSAKADADWSGVPLLRPDEVTDSHQARASGLSLCVVTSPYVPLERSLSAQGFKDIVPFFDLAEGFRHLHPLSNGWFAPP